MSASNISESRAASLALVLGLLSSCSDHHVSPWGVRGEPTLRPYVARADLGEKLASIDAETSALGLERFFERRVDPPHEGPLVIRAYRGLDAGGRRIHAVRVASERGVVLAIGPLDAHEVDRTQATELIVDGELPPPGTDVNGDGRPDVVVRNEAGTLAVWGLAGTGASAYPIRMRLRPTRLVDVDGDGRLDLVGAIALPEAHPLAARLEDEAVFDAGEYGDDGPKARSVYTAALERIAADEAAEQPKLADDAGVNAIADAGASQGTAPEGVRLRRVLERAWCRVLLGDSKDAAIQALDREVVPPDLRASFTAYRQRIAEAANTSRP